MLLSAGEEWAIVGEIIDTHADLRTLEKGIAQQAVETRGNGARKEVGRTPSGGECGGVFDGICHECVDHSQSGCPGSGGDSRKRTMGAEREGGEEIQTEE